MKNKDEIIDKYKLLLQLIDDDHEILTSLYKFEFLKELIDFMEDSFEINWYMEVGGYMYKDSDEARSIDYKRGAIDDAMSKLQDE